MPKYTIRFSEIFTKNNFNLNSNEIFYLCTLEFEVVSTFKNKHFLKFNSMMNYTYMYRFSVLEKEIEHKLTV